MPTAIACLEKEYSVSVKAVFRSSIAVSVPGHFQANSPANFAERLRFFANMELRVGNATFGKLIGIRGNWVKAHCRLRDEKIKETGTIVPEDDYLNAMDQ